MINSIQHFQEKGVKNLTEIFSHYTDDPTKFAEMVYGVTKEVTKLGLSLIEEELESYDELLRKGWYIERRDETKLLTSQGENCYSRTYFHNKETGEYCYLLDHLMSLESHARISEDADEDHVSLQYLEKKGDIKKPRINTVMPKLIYVYEDVNFDGSKHELVNCHYFGGDYAGTEGTKALWQEVFAFVAESYDEEVLEKIYINGDGADWIRTGAGMHAKARFVLDRFHMHKYIISATSHPKDSAQDARSEIYKAINGKRKWAAEEAFDKILHVTESETKAKAVEFAKNYILGNWTGIMESVKTKDKSLQC